MDKEENGRVLKLRETFFSTPQTLPVLSPILLNRSSFARLYAHSRFSFSPAGNPAQRAYPDDPTCVFASAVHPRVCARAVGAGGWRFPLSRLGTNGGG